MVRSGALRAFVLAYAAIKLTLLIYLNIRLVATGGIFAPAFRSMPFSISAGVGFIALFGVAMLIGVVLMFYVLQMRDQGPGARRSGPQESRDSSEAVASDRLWRAWAFCGWNGARRGEHSDSS